jgi:hypothetical protein
LSDLAASGTGEPEDVKSTATYRGLKVAVILLGVLIAIAFAILVIGLGVKLAAHGRPAPTAGFVLPPGAAITGTAVQNDRLIMRVKTLTGEEIDIVDTTNGHLVARIETTQAR